MSDGNPADAPAVLNLRTTRQVREKLQQVADENERSMNWMHEKLLRKALGLDGKNQRRASEVS